MTIVANESSFGSQHLNATSASMLGLLARRPMSGWDIYESFEVSIGHFWSITRSQIYRELQALAKAGLIECVANGIRDRRVYTITEAGHAAFAAWIVRMPGEEQIRFPLLLTTFFGDSVSSDFLRRECSTQRRTHAARLARYEAQLAESQAEKPYHVLALEFGLAYERAVLAWIDGLPWMAAGSRAKD